jgi:hypothetical protein
MSWSRWIAYAGSRTLTMFNRPRECSGLGAGSGMRDRRSSPPTI